MSLESDIFEGFGAMTLDDTSSSTRKLKKENTISLKKKNKKKKEEVIRKLCSGGVKKKKSNNNNNAAGVRIERRKARIVDKFNAGLPKGWGRIYYGVDRSVSGAMFFAEITYPDGRKVCLGTYKSPKLAAMAYDKAALQIYGLQAPLNFLSSSSDLSNNNK